MKSMILYNSIINSLPTLREYHGSRSKYSKCNNKDCELNGGKESHRNSMNELHNITDKKYEEIIRGNNGKNL